jgi:hypothetical protein
MAMSRLLSHLSQHALLSSLISNHHSPAFGAAATAMGELTVAGCIGAACVQQQMITPAMVRALSQTIFHVLLPLFMATNILKTVVVTTTTTGRSSSSLSSSLLAVPLLAALQAAIMFALCSNMLIPLFFGVDYSRDSKNDEAKTLAVTCSFGNAGVLPFVFVEAMFRTASSPLPLLEQAYSQVSLFSAGWSPFFWSFVPKVLGIGTTRGKKASTIEENTASTGCHTTLRRVAMGRFLRDRLQVYFPPPVMGVVAGLLLGLSPLSSLLLLSTSASDGDKNTAPPPPPLAFIYNSCQNLGKAANPLAVLVLACSLALGATMTTTKQEQEKLQPKTAAVATATATTTTGGAGEQPPSLIQRWACVSLARFVLSPLVMLGLLYIMSSSSSTRFNLIPSHRAEPMLWFICLLEAVMPPAQNSVVLLQVAGRPRDAEQMATFLFYIYATSIVPVVVLITVALQWLEILPSSS